MITKESIVRTADGDEWTFNLSLPESLQEAEEVYGSEGALYLLTSGLIVKEQNVAREMFRNGKSREEVDQAVASYRPGGGARTSAKATALKLITDKADILKENPDLMAQVQDAFVAGKFKDVVELLS